MTSSAALTTNSDQLLREHLLRHDGQEDLCFALHRPSRGHRRNTHLISEPILPEPGEREVHGNAGFRAEYFLRAADRAAAEGTGLVLLHSHPGGRGWQDLSRDDIEAERGHAAQTIALTGQPLIGMTLAGDGAWSARTWARVGRGDYTRADHATVRVVGDRLQLTHHPRLSPAHAANDALQRRTISAWGVDAQAALARLRIGIIGAGSVGALVAEALARTGIRQLVLIDFDSIKTHNLDRLLHAAAGDVRLARSKVETLQRALRRSATASDPIIEAHELSIVEPAGFAHALDCDVLFSCVDRPWPRYALNLIAYAHLIPVIDGGIKVTTADGMRLTGADWRAHVAAPTRQCLECLGQYDPGLVASEREPTRRPALHRRAPARPPGPRQRERLRVQHEHSRHGDAADALDGDRPQRRQRRRRPALPLRHRPLDTDSHACRSRCPFSNDLLAQGENCAVPITGAHAAADAERAHRRARRRSPRIRVNDLIDRILDRVR